VRLRCKRARTPRAPTKTRSAAPHSQVDASGTGAADSVSASAARKPDGALCALIPKLVPLTVR